MVHVWQSGDNFVESVLSFYFYWVLGLNLGHRACAPKRFYSSVWSDCLLAELLLLLFFFLIVLVS